VVTESSLLEQLVDRLTNAILDRYRADRNTAVSIARDSLAASPALGKVLEHETDVDRIVRTRAFRDVATAAKRRVYYRLREYKPDAAKLTGLVDELAALPRTAPSAELRRLTRSIAELHVSTRERVPASDDFRAALAAHTAPPRTVLDVGCGVYPLLFPFSGWGREVEAYVAIDSDPMCVRAVEAFAKFLRPGVLRAIRWDFGAGWSELRACTGIDSYDVALLLKVVPVVARQTRSCLAVLAQTPADACVVTGSAVAMAKRRGIAARERTVLRKFAESARRPIVAEFAAGEEFGFILGAADPFHGSSPP
jgi:16S rRNA (guanine(1405)-N(7))-methyltransferase